MISRYQKERRDPFRFKLTLPRKHKHNEISTPNPNLSTSTISDPKFGPKKINSMEEETKADVSQTKSGILGKEDPEQPETEEESEEESGEDSGEEDSSEEEEEPKLKYQRLGASVPQILKRDSASAVAIHEKFIALGSHEGWIHILDFNGNETRSISAHSATINGLSIDSSGAYVASCSDDGTVVINGVWSGECEKSSYARPVQTVALDPNYSKKSQRFASGGRAGQLLLNTKGGIASALAPWFGQKDTVVHSGEGPIYAIAWRSSLIAWANDVGIKIYDCATNQRITYIDRPKGSPRADLFRCHLCWENDSTLLIGWADCVKIAVVKEKPADQATPGTPNRYSEIISLFQTDYYICGLAPFGEYLVVLAYILESDAKGEHVQRPELRIVSRANVDHILTVSSQISSDALSINGFQNYRAHDYHVAFLAAESLFYIVSPKDIVVAKPRDMDDHISWLLERERYEDALAAAREHKSELKSHNIVDVAEKVMGHLMQENEFGRAAEMCVSVLGDSVRLWEKWVRLFVRFNQLQALLHLIPTRTPKLTAPLYETVLFSLLASDNKALLATVSRWPADLYSIPKVIEGVKTALKSCKPDKQSVLSEILAKLHQHNREYEQTLHIYFKLRNPELFNLIATYDLYDHIKDKILQLMQFDEEKTVKLLVGVMDESRLVNVMTQLKDHPRWQFLLLDSLFERNPTLGRPFHDLQVGLYAEYDRSKLLGFLRKSQNYSLENAHAICKAKEFWEEVVFVLSRMGNNKTALNLIMEKMTNVRQAVDFCVDHNDDELWEDLIQHCLQNQELVAPLLNDIGPHIQPLKIVRQIPHGMVIPGLRDKLIKIISDYMLQLNLREGCNNILMSDCVALAKRLNRGQRRGIRVNNDARCGVCSGAIVGSFPRQNTVVFFCSHSYHEECLKASGGETGKKFCLMCKKKKGPAAARSGPQ